MLHPYTYTIMAEIHFLVAHKNDANWYTYRHDPSGRNVYNSNMVNSELIDD